MECLSPQFWLEPGYCLCSFSQCPSISATLFHGLKTISSFVKDVVLKKIVAMCFEDVIHSATKLMTQKLFELRPIWVLSLGWLNCDTFKKPFIRKLSAAVLCKSELLKKAEIPVVFRWVSKKIWQTFLGAMRSSDFQKEKKPNTSQHIK